MLDAVQVKLLEAVQVNCAGKVARCCPGKVKVKSLDAVQVKSLDAVQVKWLDAVLSLGAAQNQSGCDGGINWHWDQVINPPSLPCSVHSLREVRSFREQEITRPTVPPSNVAAIQN